MQAERRELSILFCDILDSTAMADQLPLDDFLDIIQSYHRSVYQSITVQYGYVAQHLGDGVMAYFGYPVYFAEAPRNAIRTGFQLIESMAPVRERARRVNSDINIRISIHTGMVVMADLGLGDRKERLALGGTPNIAARLQSIAPTNGIAVSEDTYNRTSKDFEFSDLGTFQLKGLITPMKVYQPLRPK